MGAATKLKGVLRLGFIVYQNEVPKYLDHKTVSLVEDILCASPWPPGLSTALIEELSAGTYKARVAIKTEEGWGDYAAASNVVRCAGMHPVHRTSWLPWRHPLISLEKVSEQSIYVDWENAAHKSGVTRCGVVVYKDGVPKYL